MDLQTNNQICQKCINFLVEDNNITCDYEHFVNIKQDQAILFVPIMFECDDFELNPNIK